MLNTHYLWMSLMTPIVTFFILQHYYFYQPKPIYSEQSLLEATIGIVLKPYPKVQSLVANFHDTDMPISTIHSWVLDLICALINFYLNQSFLPYCTITITHIVTQPVLSPHKTCPSCQSGLGHN